MPLPLPMINFSPCVMLSEAKHLKHAATNEVLRFAQNDRIIETKFSDRL